MSTVHVSCVECGNFQWEFWYDTPDASVGYSGGLTLESPEEVCPHCHEPAPGEGTAEHALERMAQDGGEDDRCGDEGAEVEWEVRR